MIALATSDDHRIGAYSIPEPLAKIGTGIHLLTLRTGEDSSQYIGWTLMPPATTMCAVLTRWLKLKVEFGATVYQNFSHSYPNFTNPLVLRSMSARFMNAFSASSSSCGHVCSTHISPLLASTLVHCWQVVKITCSLRLRMNEYTSGCIVMHR